MVLEYLSGIRVNYKKWTETPGNLWQQIKKYTQEAMLHIGNTYYTYVSWKNSGRGLIGCKNSVKSEENGLGWYVKNNIEPILVAVRTSRTVHEETVNPKEFKKTKEEQTKNEWTAKRMDVQFTRDMEDKDKNNTWRWMKKSDLKRCTKVLLKALELRSELNMFRNQRC